MDKVIEAPPQAAAVDLPQLDSRYFNRELSWLAFNRRVLEEACNARHPLLERLRFLSISASNLDEFFMVRVAGLKAHQAMGVEELSIDGMTLTQQLAVTIAEADRLVTSQHEVWAELQSELDRAGSPGMRMKRGIVVGAMISSRTVVFPFLSSKIRLSPWLGMNGNGCAGSIACGVSTGKICSRKCWSSHFSALSSSDSSAITCIPTASSSDCSPAHTSCWLVTSLSASAMIAASCCVTVSPSGETSCTPIA